MATAVVVADFTVEAAVVADSTAAALVEAAATTVAADITVAGGLMAEEVTAEAAAFVVDQRPVVRERAAVRTAGPKLPAIPVGEIGRLMSVPQSPMASGILSATRAVPRVLVPAIPCVLVPAIPRAPVKLALPEAQRTQASPLVTAEIPMALGTPLARQEATPVSPTEPPELRQASVGVALVGVALVGEAALVGAAVALVGAAVALVGAGAAGAGEVGVGASASDGRTGDLAGG
ncbi:MAG: hypothetical protein WBC78_25135 [Candidatus Sulfotelmatobacter sp.]